MTRLVGPSLLVVGGLTLLLASVGWYALVAPLSDPAPLPVPERLAGSALTGNAFGREAVQEITALHEQGFPLTGGAVAYYGDGTATLWVAKTWGAWAAERLVDSMTSAIGQSDSPFTPLGLQRVEGRLVFEVSGLDQTHFYLQAADRVIWLTVAPAQAEEALRDVLAFAW